MTIKHAVSWWCYENSGLTAEALMQAIADIGYDAVELLPPELLSLPGRYGLEIASIKGHDPLEVGLNKRENLEDIAAQLRQSVEQAQEYQIPNVIVFSGNRDGQSDADGLEITVANLQQVMHLAEAAGVTFVLELLNSRVDHPDYMADSTAWGLEVCRRVNSPNLALLYDIYHMAVMGEDVFADIEQHHAAFDHYHTAGVPGRAEIDAAQTLDYAAICRAIADTGYDGYIGQEFIPQGDPLTALREALRICKVG